MSSNVSTTKIVIECFDVSNEYLIKKVCGYIDNGIKVNVLSIEKKEGSVTTEYTFMGTLAEQERPGMILSSYKDRVGDCLIQID